MAIHIKELNIDTFRGIKNLELKNLGDINLITGDNNTGKTSVLEIINTLSEPSELKSWAKLGDKRKLNNMSLYDSFEMLFDINKENKKIQYSIIDRSNHKSTIEINADNTIIEMQQGEMDKLRNISTTILSDDGSPDYADEYSSKIVDVNKYDISFKVNGNIANKDSLLEFQSYLKINKEKKIKPIQNIVYISPTQHSWSEVFLSEILDNPSLYEEMLTVLKLFDDGIISINADNSNNKFSNRPVYKILSKNNNTAIPLNFYGDGIKKAILLLSAVVKAKDGILLLDEFEIAIHTSAMNEIFAWIINTCIRLNVQLFMTSHSEEAIDKILKCSPEIQDKMRLITLYSNEDKTVARVLDGKKAIKLKDDLGVELR